MILQLREAARKTASGTTSARTRSAQRRGEFALFYSRKFGLEIKIKKKKLLTFLLSSVI